jgi:hypothetical protein
VHCFAAAAGAEHVIQELTTTYLALTAIDNTGVFIGPCADWRKHAVAEQTLMNFTSDFMHAWKECGCLISAKSAGYQALLITHADHKEMTNLPTCPIRISRMCWSIVLKCTTAGVMAWDSIPATTVKLATARKPDTVTMLPSNTTRPEAIVSGKTITTGARRDGSHWMILKSVKILIQTFFNTLMVPRMSRIIVLRPILLQLTTFSHPISNQQPTTQLIKICAANGGILESTHVGKISLPLLPLQAQHVHVVPGLASMSLLAMGPLCDARCTIKFNAITAHVWLQEQVVLEGRRNLPGLWVFQLLMPAVPVLPTNNTIVPQVNSAIGAPKAVELVAYSHATLFLPALSTLEKVLKCGYVHNFPDLTAKMLQCHLPRSVTTAKGHLDQV